MNEINAELALDRIDQKFERLRVRLAAAEAERDAARAGEARAVEALEAEQRAAHWRNLARITDKHEDHIEATRLSEIAQRLRHGIVLVLDRNISALDWLAQQRAEAAAESEDAKRNLWCEEKRVTVSHNAMTNKWTVITEEAAPWRRRYFDGKTRNEAIDKALRAGATGGKP